MKDVHAKAIELMDREIGKIVAKNDISPSELECFYKVIDIEKDIYEICEKEAKLNGGMYEDEYSMRGISMYPGNRPNYGYGNYSHNGMYPGLSYSMSNGNGYSNNSSRSDLMDHIQTMINSAPNEQERAMYQRWYNEAASNNRR